MENLKKILKKNIKDEDNLIENILPHGVTIFAGKPKVGKTFFLLQLALSLGKTYDSFLGNKSANAYVLYYSNETNEKEIQKRFNLLRVENEDIEHISIDFANPITLNNIECDLSILRDKISKKTPILVIIDTFQNVQYQSTFDMNKYQDVYKIIQQYNTLASNYMASFILVFHLNKSSQGNIQDRIYGSGGLEGAAENILVLVKNSEDDYSLNITSRYVPSNTLNMKKQENNFFEIASNPLLINSDPDLIQLINYITQQR